MHSLATHTAGIGWCAGQGVQFQTCRLSDNAAYPRFPHRTPQCPLFAVLLPPPVVDAYSHRLCRERGWWYPENVPRFFFSDPNERSCCPALTIVGFFFTNECSAAACADGECRRDCSCCSVARRPHRCAVVIRRISVVLLEWKRPVSAEGWWYPPNAVVSNATCSRRPRSVALSFRPPIKYHNRMRRRFLHGWCNTPLSPRFI